MEVEEGEAEGAGYDGGGREDGGLCWTEVGGEADSGQDGDRLGQLEEAPGPGKIPRSHLLEDEHLEGVAVGPAGDAGHPDPVRGGGEAEQGQTCCEAGSLTEVLAAVAGQEGGEAQQAGHHHPHHPAQPHLPLHLRAGDEEQEGGEQPQGDEGGGQEDDLETPAPQAGEIKEWQFVLLSLVLVLDLPLLRLEVKDGSSLRVVESGRPVEGAEDEGGGQHPGD